MNSYTDESGFDGVVPAHPIECENPLRVRTMTLGDIARMALETNNMRSTGEKPNPFVSPLDKGSQTTMVGKGDEEVAREIRRLVIDLLERQKKATSGFLAIEEMIDVNIEPILAKYRQQAVAEVMAGLVLKPMNIHPAAEVGCTIIRSDNTITKGQWDGIQWICQGNTRKAVGWIETAPLCSALSAATPRREGK
ncbi:hypothetical protein ELG64_08990 [Rhizobium leguminosarum]|uniref:hypothetical protein n=1 Tax=Rhizobium leguminosarum TaxID=384 RepID=UPI001031C8F6|nr:hypothetical protein [Rhizobium leguminosarum]TBH23629.1 hypothetical protein ELG64_08990 [Rhizobium leguminosarum]